MGVLGWMTSRARRQAAIDTVTTFFEVSKKLGTFPASADPAGASREAIDLALARVPELIERRWSKYVLASTCLALILLEEDEPLAVRDIHAMALYGILEAANLQRHQLSYEELSALDSARRAYLVFRTVKPSPAAPLGRTLDPGPITTAHPAGADSVSLTPRERELARAELVRRMQEADGKP
jgi:hypothetical protein